MVGPNYQIWVAVDNQTVASVATAILRILGNKAGPKMRCRNEIGRRRLLMKKREICDEERSQGAELRQDVKRLDHLH